MAAPVSELMTTIMLGLVFVYAGWRFQFNAVEFGPFTINKVTPGGFTTFVSSLLMGRPYVVPDGVPEDRVKILRDGFMAAMKNPELLAEAKRQHLEIDAIDGDAVRKVLERMYATPQPIVDEITSIFVPKDK